MSETPAKPPAVNAESGEAGGGAPDKPAGEGQGKGRRRRNRSRGGDSSGDKKPREEGRSGGRDGREARPKKGGGRGRRDARGGGRDGGRGRGRDRDRGSGTLTAGLFSSVSDKEVPCRVGGCKKTWTWWGSEQIKAFGQAPPKRMCDEHLAAFHELEDKEVACRNAGCTNTWTWKRGAQLHQLQRSENLKTPRRLCESCAGEEKNITDSQIECRVPGCDHTWKWTADAQRRHASWLRREKAKLEAAESKDQSAQIEAAKAESAEPAKAAAEHAAAEAPTAETPKVDAAETEAASHAADVGADLASTAEASGVSGEVAAEAQGEPPAAAAPVSAEAGGAQVAPAEQGEAAPKKRKRRRRKNKRQKKLQEGPPEKLCDGCSEQIKKFAPAEQPCKVHGCKDHWSWDREHQLRAWVAAGRPEDTSTIKPPKGQRRMCNSCRDFCRSHKDREVTCGKPECEKTWTYKTGAQLQDQLAGRTADPIKLCEDCMREQFVAPGVASGALPEGSEVMPCGVGGCEGKWIYIPGMELLPSEGDEVPVDRMCDKCRGERDLPARGGVTQPETASEPAVEATPDEATKAGQSDAQDAEAPQQSDSTPPEPEPEPAPEVPLSGDEDSSTDPG